MKVEIEEKKAIIFAHIILVNLKNLWEYWKTIIMNYFIEKVKKKQKNI